VIKYQLHIQCHKRGIMMKVRYITGDLLSVKSGIIVHGCNSKGKMGAGIALAIRDKWPSVYEHYLMWDRPVGDVQFNRVGDLIIVNAITQETYGTGLRVDYNVVRNCFTKIFKRAKANNMFCISIPKIGASSLSTMIYAANEAQWDGSLNIYSLD